MEFILGEDLKDIWESLSTLNKLWVAWTLRVRGYVAQFHVVHLASRNLPAIDGSGSALHCIDHYFTKMGAGLFCLLSGNVFLVQKISPYSPA